MAFKLPELSYSYDALEPHIDAKTVEIHHSKHHAAYTNNFNNAIAGTEYEGKSAEEIFANLDMNNKAVRNNGGGYYNHRLYWDVINPEGKGYLSGELKDAIIKKFGSVEEFKNALAKAAGTQFGSGWAWLCVQKGGEVDICATPNQDNPIMPNIGCGGFPILTIDVWEHAYYLNYQNRRPDYIETFFKLINWNFVEKLYNENK